MKYYNDNAVNQGGCLGRDTRTATYMGTKITNPTGLRTLNSGCREGVKEREEEKGSRVGEVKGSVRSTINGS